MRIFVSLMMAMLLLAGCGGEVVEPAPEATAMMPTAIPVEDTPVQADTSEPDVACSIPVPSSEIWRISLCETFDDNAYGWQEETQDNPYSAYTSAVKDGKFTVDYRAKNFAGFTQSAVTWFDVAQNKNFILSVTGQIESSFADTSWGVAFRGNGQDFLLFTINNDDNYVFEVFEDNVWLPLITNKQTNLIKVGEPNTLRIEAVGQDMYFSINGAMVNQYSGVTLDGDQIQLMVSAKEGVTALFSFDDVVLQE